MEVQVALDSLNREGLDFSVLDTAVLDWNRTTNKEREGGGGERETDRERQREIERQRHRYRQRQRHTERQTQSCIAVMVLNERTQRPPQHQQPARKLLITYVCPPV